MPLLGSTSRRLPQSLPLSLLVFARSGIYCYDYYCISSTGTRRNLDPDWNFTCFCTSSLWYRNDTLATRSYDGMFWAQDKNLVIIQILASIRRIIITTLITFAFSLILPFASLVRGITVLGLLTISS